MPTDPYTATGLPRVIELTVGDSHIISGVQVVDALAAIIPIDGSTTAKFTVALDWDASTGSTHLFQLTVGDGITVNDGPNTIDLGFSIARTALLVGRYGGLARFLYELEVDVDGAGDVHTVQRGIILAHQSVD